MGKIDIDQFLLEQIRTGDVAICIGPEVAASSGLPGYPQLTLIFLEMAEQAGAALDYGQAVLASLTRAGRSAVISNLKKLLTDPVSSRQADLRAYQEIAGSRFWRDILYTYWDDLFDEVNFEGGKPFKVYDDSTLLTSSNRKVKIYKICGDFSNLTSIRLYDEDISALESTDFFNDIKHILGNKHVLFLGYGRQGSYYPVLNLLKLWLAIQRKRGETSKYAKAAYLVSDDIHESQIQGLRTKGIYCIRGAELEFLKQLNEELESVNAPSRTRNDLIYSLENMDPARFSSLCQDLLRAEGFTLGDAMPGLETVSGHHIFDKNHKPAVLICTPQLKESYYDFDLDLVGKADLHIMTANMREGNLILERLRELRAGRSLEFWDGYMLARFLKGHLDITKKYGLENTRFPEVLKSFYRYTVSQFQNLPIANAHLFYSGHQPTFVEINSSLDARRVVDSSGTSLAYPELLEKVIQQALRIKSNPGLILFKGVAGNGKSTLLKRLEYDLFHSEQSKQFSLLELAGESPRLGELASEYSSTKNTIILFVDIHDTRKQIAALGQLSTGLWESGIPVLFILAVRENEWNSAHGTDEIVANPKSEFFLKDKLEDGEARDLCTLFNKHQIFSPPYSSWSFEAQVKRLLQASDTGGQLLPSLYWATKGKRFEEIVVDEFRKLQVDDPALALAYKYTFFTHALGQAMPLVPLSKILHMDTVQFFLRTGTTAKGLFVTPEYSTSLLTRHRTIAEMLTGNTPEFHELQALTEFVSRMVDVIDVTEDEERYLVLKVLLGLAEPLKTLRSKIAEARPVWRSAALEIAAKYEPALLEMVNYARDQGRAIELTEWGRMYHVLGDPDRNIECLRGALKLTSSTDEIGLISYFLGKTYKEIGDNQHAENFLQKAGRTELQSQEYLNFYARFQIDRGDFEDAARLLGNALLRNPGNKFTRLTFRKLLSRLRKEGLLDRAIQVCESALEVNPESAWTLWNLASFMRQVGRYDDAKNSLRKALSAQSMQKDILWARTANDLAWLLLQSTPLDDAEAEELWKQSIRDCPVFVVSYLSYGKFLTSKGRYDEAIACFKAALRADPSRTEFVRQELEKYANNLKEKEPRMYKELISR